MIHAAVWIVSFVVVAVTCAVVAGVLFTLGGLAIGWVGRAVDRTIYVVGIAAGLILVSPYLGWLWLRRWIRRRRLVEAHVD